MVCPMHEYTINGCRNTDSHTSAVTPFRMLINDSATLDRFPPTFNWPVLQHLCCSGNDLKCQDVPHDWKGAIMHVHSTMFTYCLRMESVTKWKECPLYFGCFGPLFWFDQTFSSLALESFHSKGRWSSRICFRKWQRPSVSKWTYTTLIKRWCIDPCTLLYIFCSDRSIYMSQNN